MNSEQRELSAGLAALAREDRRRSAPSSVETKLLAALPKTIPSRGFDWRAVGAVAAALLMVVLALTYRVAPKPNSTAPKTAPTNIKASLPRAPDRREVLEPQPRPRLRRVHAASSHRTSPAELAVSTGTPFFPLPFSEPLDPRESGEVWRVRLPRSTMASFGLPFDPARMNETINADLIVGQDGLPRAIRFLP